MKISLTMRNSIALLALSFLMQETHELAHTFVGRIICGCWGKRDFNVWGLCGDCGSAIPISVLATFAGPLYSFSVIWMGYYLLTKSSIKTKSLGFALIVSSMPFSRVLTPIFGGGDEVFTLTELGMSRSLAWPLALILVFPLAVLPVVKVYNVIENRRKPLWIIGLLIVPFLAVGAIVFGILQSMVLRNGILDDYWILGSPILATGWLFVSAGTFVAFRRHIVTLLRGDC
jgi:hypothetical protein